MSEHWIVRHYDGMDNEWMDVSEPVTRREAERILAEKTDRGRHNTSYTDIDYYDIFPANTTMVNSKKGNRELGIKTIR